MGKVYVCDRCGKVIEGETWLVYVVPRSTDWYAMTHSGCDMAVCGRCRTELLERRYR